MEVGFRQGWGPDSRPKPPEKALDRNGEGGHGLNPTKGASAVPLALVCRG